MRTPHILVVDDEPAVQKLIARVMTEAGFTARVAGSAAEIPAAVRERTPDLIILDYNLPESTGRDACIRIRRDEATRTVPVIIITGQEQNGLPVDCLQAGADDFVSKPFDPKELVARVQAVLRRPRSMADEQADIRKGVVELQPTQRRILVSGKPVARLTPKEFDLLHQIILHAPRVLAKNVLALKVWGQTLDLINERSVDVHIRRIRAKLGPEAAKFLQTVPSVGYQWVDPSQTPES
jgi:two-component system, OmpR family, phosphate regulon response regulator PhoB